MHQYVVRLRFAAVCEKLGVCDNPHHRTAVYPCSTAITWSYALIGQVKSGPAFYRAPGSSLVAVMVSYTIKPLRKAIIEHAALSRTSFIIFGFVQA